MDGVASDPELVADLQAIDQGAVPHWHGLRPDLHAAGLKDDEPHGKKIHVLFSKKRVGLAASRADAVDFIRLLEKKHQEAGLKSPQEDLILLLLQPGAQLVSHNWLGAVTPALIVPPPILQHEKRENAALAMKLSNAISFAVVEHGSSSFPPKATSFDYSLKPIWKDPNAKDMALSNGMSFPTPALAGAATAMRLDTYTNLPSQDETLTKEWLVNLDLSLNLWLCADGIDVLTEVSVEAPIEDARSELTPREMARFAAAWMDVQSATDTYYHYVISKMTTTTKTNQHLTRLEWDTMMANAKASQNFAAGLQTKCRPFSWYAEEINTELVPPKQVADDALWDDVLTKDEENVDENKDKGKDGNEKENENANKGDAQSPEEAVPPPRHDPRLPSKPIPQSRLDLLASARPIDLTYVDVTGGFKEFPHKGAKDGKL